MSLHNTDFCRQLGIIHPIVQGPMNGASSPELVAAVSNAGGLGSFAAALLSPAAIIEGVEKIRALTSQPFSVNLFILETPKPDPAGIAQAHTLLAPFRSALDLGPASTPDKFCEDFPSQLAALLHAAPPVVSFTFGILEQAMVARFHDAGCKVIGTATTVAEALAWEQAGADFICAQGAEAGGHRGTFMGDIEQSCIGLMALIPQVSAAVSVPVIAAGGMMNGRGIVASLMLGAQAAQLGTAFLSCPECPIPPAWKQALLLARDDSTRLTRTFSGRHARGIVNAFMEQMRAHENEVPPYPIQNALTSPIRQAAGRLGRPELLSLWAGQGVAMSRTMPAATLVDTLAKEIDEAVSYMQQGKRAAS